MRIVRHAAKGWAKSIYVLDPNGLQLEVCNILRSFVAEDATPQVRFRREGTVKTVPKAARAS